MPMSAIQYMKQSLDFVHRALAGAGDGLSAEQLHTVPDGESHSIAWVMWHGARVEDLIVQQIIKGEQMEWERGGWAARTGLPAQGFGTGQTTEEARAIHVGDADAFLQYAGQVTKLTDELLDRLSDDGLEREVKVGQRTETVGQCITLHLITHLNGHRGEVNLLRGMMGLPPVLVNQGG
jgi:uncharacterized damage-inducible protein DinB